jgi:flagellin
MRIPSQFGVGNQGLRDLQRSLLEVSRIQERLASGSRINRAADDPSGLSISERLRAQIAGLSQAVENTERGSNLIRTAEGGLQQTSDLLVRARGLALAASNSGGLSDDEVSALQGALDGILGAIDRIANTTDFGGKPLLNGAQAFVLKDVDAQFREVTVRSASLPEGGITVEVAVSAPATRAQAAGAIAAGQSAASTVEIRGALGVEVVTVGAGASRADVAAAINAVKENTGVEADETTGAIFSTAFGSGALVEIREVEGDLEGVAAGRSEGTDTAATVEGIAADARGFRLEVSGAPLDARILLEEDTAAGTYTFRIAGGGARLQVGDAAQPNEQLRIGIRSALTGTLGTAVASGGLRTLRTGGANDLRSDPDQAFRVIDAAVRDVSALRSDLGSVDRNTFEPNIRSLQVAAENVMAAESRIRDTDFARSITDLARERIREQSALSALLHQRLSSESVLRLLA